MICDGRATPIELTGVPSRREPAVAAAAGLVAKEVFHNALVIGLTGNFRWIDLNILDAATVRSVLRLRGEVYLLLPSTEVVRCKFPRAWPNQTRWRRLSAGVATATQRSFGSMAGLGQLRHLTARMTCRGSARANPTAAPREGCVAGVRTPCPEFYSS